MNEIKLSKLREAITNWQNVVGGHMNGQLEAYLGMSLGYSYSVRQTVIKVTQEQENRINILLSDNHPTLIKVYLAKQD